jgi:hypothetical protein
MGKWVAAAILLVLPVVAAFVPHVPTCLPRPPTARLALARRPADYKMMHRGGESISLPAFIRWLVPWHRYPPNIPAPTCMQIVSMCFESKLILAVSSTS